MTTALSAFRAYARAYALGTDADVMAAEDICRAVAKRVGRPGATQRFATVWSKSINHFAKQAR